MEERKETVRLCSLGPLGRKTSTLLGKVRWFGPVAPLNSDNTWQVAAPHFACDRPGMC